VMRTIQFSLLSLILLLMLIPPATAGTNPGVNDYFPPIAGNSPDGEPFDLADHLNTGKYILVDFWAYWCGPCRREIPTLVEAWNTYGGDKFMILGVNMDRPGTVDKYYEYIEEEGITFPQITEWAGWDTSWAKDLGVRYVPQNFLMAPDGRVIFRDLRGEHVLPTIAGLMKLNRPYEPITMSIVVQDDPRLDESYYKPPRGNWDCLIVPFAKPLNIAPDSLKLRINIDNPQAKDFKATLHYELYRPTGRRTHRVKDQMTGEVYRHWITGDPYIQYEVEVEELEAMLIGRNGKIMTGYEIPLGEDVWEVKWWLTVHSPWLDIDLKDADDSIDFAGYWTVTPETIQKQGGIFFAKDEEEEGEEGGE